MPANYTKMNGLKNDFIVFRGPMKLSSEKVASLCDHNNSIGADGVLIVTGDKQGRVKMEYWNAGGSKAEMCGNGLRCVARFAVDNKLVPAGRFIVNTPAGPLEVVCGNNPDEEIEVQVGEVEAETEPITLHGYSFYKANVGNPHAITFVDNSDDAPVATVGPVVETDEHFPNKTNVEFAQILDKNNIRLRVWERGVGETKACGTGIVATAVLSSKLKKTTLPVTVKVKGGDAKVWLDEKGYARLRGPVETTKTGQVQV